MKITSPAEEAATGQGVSASLTQAAASPGLVSATRRRSSLEHCLSEVSSLLIDYSYSSPSCSCLGDVFPAAWTPSLSSS